MDEELYTPSQQTIEAMMRRIVALESRYRGGASDHQYDGYPDFPFPAVTTEAIGSLAVGGIQRRINVQTIASPVWANSSITGERAFNPGGALESGADVTVYREPSKGGLVIIPNAASSTCACKLLELVELFHPTPTAAQQTAIDEFKQECGCGCKLCDAPSKIAMTLSDFSDETSVFSGTTQRHRVSDLNGQQLTLALAEQTSEFCRWRVDNTIAYRVTGVSNTNVIRTIQNQDNIDLQYNGGSGLDAWGITPVSVATPLQFVVHWTTPNQIKCGELMGQTFDAEVDVWPINNTVFTTGGKITFGEA